jgi:hypothetical protein
MGVDKEQATKSAVVTKQTNPLCTKRYRATNVLRAVTTHNFNNMHAHW